jgi:hypothetical protein
LISEQAPQNGFFEQHRSGQETSGEAARTNRNQAGVDRQVHNEHAANGGKLIGQELKQVNHEQNRDSRQISDQKHNGATAHPHR